MSVLLGQGDGTLSAHVDYPVGGAASVALADMDGDGDLDVVTGGAVSVLLGKGDGTFPTRIDYATDSISVVLGDMNRDGRPDLVAATGLSSIAVLLNTCQ